MRVLLIDGAAGASTARDELLAAANALAGPSGCAATLATLPADVATGADAVDGLVVALASIATDVRPDAIVLRGGHLAALLAPRLAVRLGGAALVTEVAAIHRDADGLVLVRQTRAGRRAWRIGHPAAPVVVVLRPGAFSPAALPSPAPAREVEVAPAPAQGESRVTFVARRPRDPNGDIRDAEILVSGGGGAVDAFEGLERLAQLLGGRVSASRRAVDQEAAARERQVGQSGRTVSPRLYLAIGIDGAGQHVEGLRDVETLIAVNTNRHAPICSISDLVIEGDATETIDRLTRRLAAGHPATHHP